MNKKLMEQMLSSEMKEIKGGATGTCVCESGAGETVVIIKNPDNSDKTTKPTNPKPPV